MANYANIKATIDANIKANGNEEITGPVLNTVLQQIVDTIVAGGYIYKGFAHPTTLPDLPDANIFYLAQGEGNYLNFGDGIYLPTGDLYALLYDGNWTNVNLMTRTKSTPFDLNLLAQNVVNYYIQSSSNTWRASANYTMFCIPLVPGFSYRVTAKPTTSTLCAVLKTFPAAPAVGSSVRYATGEGFRALSSRQSAVIEVPSDGYYMAVSAMWGGIDRTPAEISILTAWDTAPFPTHPQFITPGFSSHRLVECRTNSQNFGKILTLSSASFGVSQAIRVAGARWVRFFTGVLSTSADIYDRTGACFYAKDMTPLQDGVWTVGKSVYAFTGWVDLEVPQGAEYLIFTQTAGAAQSGNKVEIHYLDEDDIDTTSGAMSCPSVYFGKRISIRENRYGITLWGADNITHQSAARFGKYLFCVSEFAATVGCYDLEGRHLLCSVATGIAQKSWWHCNQCCFTDKYYDTSDEFPLLYVSMQNDTNGRGECVAFRIVPTWSDGEISSFTFTQVQTILLPAMTDSNCLGNPNWAYDTYHRCFWIYSRNNRTGASNHLKAKYSQVSVPEIWNGDTLITQVSLTDQDILQSFDDDYSLLYAQGAFIANGKLYIGQGQPGNNTVCLRAVDLYVTRRMESYIDISSNGFEYEPEGLFEYRGQIMMTVYGPYIVRLLL